MAAAVLSAGREAPGARQERGNASDGQVIDNDAERALSGARAALNDETMEV